jgi:GrpB-like predicted nucleotidyltransferase (UPF0157 family)
MRWRDGCRTHHLHIVVHGSAQWHERLAFRDELRRDPELVLRYARLKIDLAAKCSADREACTEAKAGFVRAVVVAARPR